MNSKVWNIYLSGEIHSDWREVIESQSLELKLPVSFSAPVTDHESSDSCGEKLLGEENDSFWYDHKSSKINSIRTRTLISEADVVIVRFGQKYRQWNAAFDAGYAAALGKPLIILHPDEFRHALKEVDAAALATANDPSQIAPILQYVIKGKL